MKKVLTAAIIKFYSNTLRGGSSLPSAYRRPSTVIAKAVVRNTAAVWRDKDHDRLSNQDKWDFHLMFISQRQLCIKIAILILTSSFLKR